MKVRVLAIPAGQKADADGRSIGSDWLLADFGDDSEGCHYYLTTDGMRASELADHPELDPRPLATAFAAWLNRGGTGHFNYELP